MKCAEAESTIELVNVRMLEIGQSSINTSRLSTYLGLGGSLPSH
jgi:hypothetical protein